MYQYRKPLLGTGALATIILALLLSLGYTNAYATSEKERLQSIEDNSSLDNPEDGFVLSFKLTRDDILDTPIMYIDGEVKNNRQETANFVQVIASFYNSNNAIIGSDMTYTDPSTIRAGQSQPFKIPVGFGSNVPIDEISSIKFHIDFSNSTLS